MKRLALALAAVALAAATTAAQMTKPDANLPLVTTQGRAEVFAEPDEVRFTIEVNTEAENLAAAKQKNAELVNEAVAYLKSRGIKDEHIQTQYLNVSVQYRDRQQMDPRYFAYQSINVCLLDVDSYAAVTSGLLERGITALRGPNFGTSEREALLARARVAAVKDARERAEALAGAIGQSIGKAYRIDDVAGSYAQPQMVYARAESMAMDAAAGGPGIAAGELKLEAAVTVSFYLRE